MDVYFDDSLIGTAGSLGEVTTTANIDRGLTLEDLECANKLINKPREGSISFDNSKVDQFQLAQIMGMKVIETEIVKEYKQFRTHKKKRINKKWLKRYGTYPIYYDDVFMVNGNLIGSPKTINKIREYCRIK